MDNFLSNSAVGAANTNILVGTAKSSFCMSFEMSQNKQRIIFDPEMIIIPGVNFKSIDVRQMDSTQLSEHLYVLRTTFVRFMKNWEFDNQLLLAVS